ncbi:MAG: TonB-dependent receptor [Bryobacterales bacterium]|nr:TonB-dependent receptor [Bryobacterales bacterium]
MKYTFSLFSGKSIRIPALLILGLAFSLSAFGQAELGAILGTVQDTTGAVVPGASVAVINEDTGLTRNLITNAEGQYTANLLQIGQYSVEAEISGFNKSVVTGIVVLVNQTVRTDVVLQVGEVTETVEVTSSVPLIKTDASDVGQVVEEKQVVELPLNGRKFIQLARLGTGTLDNAKLDGVMGSATHGGGIVANGASTNANQITLDGVENQDWLIPRVGLSPSPDAIQEFKIMSGSYSAEYGRGAGAHINVAIKSGTNEFHGGVFYFHRNDNLDARNFFDRSTLPEFKRNQYGGTLGGPFVKNKTFGFYSFEGLRSGKGRTINATLATPAQRQGDLSGPGGFPIYDPLTTMTAADGVIHRDLFVDNRIPTSRLSQTTQRAMQLLWPAVQSEVPNEPNAVFNPVELNDQDQHIVRVDHRFSDNDNLFGRYGHNTNPRLLPDFLSPGLPMQGTLFGFTQQNAVLSYTKIITPNLVNEARMGYNYFFQDLSLELKDTNVVGEIGIEGALQDPVTWGPPNVNVSGMTGMGAFPFAPSVPKVHGFHYMDTLALTKGTHNIKMGIDIRRGHQNGGQFPYPRGRYGFTGGFTRNPASPAGTGQGLGDFLLGYPQNSYIIQGRTDNDIRTLNAGFYVQDNWNVHPNLTLNLGLRYNYMPAAVSAADRIVNWSEEHQALILAQTDLDKPTACAGCNGRPLRELIKDFEGIFNFMTRDQVGWPRSLYRSDNNNWSPRLGFAWRLFGSNDTVLRAAWGRFYEIIAGNVHWNFTTNPPLSRNLSFSTDPNALPAITFAQPFPGVGVQGAPGTSGGIQYDWHDPYQDNWNVSIQRRILPSTSLNVGYVGSRGVGQRMGVNFNAPEFGDGPPQPRRPHPEHGNTGINVPWGHRRYDSLQVKLETRASDLNILTSYTWANATTWGGGGINESGSGVRFPWNFPARREPVLTGILDPGDPYLARDKGSSRADVEHRLSVAFVWQLPLGRGKLIPLSGPLNWIAGGWQLNGIITHESGIALPVGYGITNTNGAAGTRPDLVGNPNSGSRNAPESWINRAAFQDPIPLAHVLASGMSPIVAAGNAGRAPIIGPGAQLWDLGVYKNFFFADEDYRLQFRFEMFNAFNHANFGNPNTNFTSNNFGRITSTFGFAREIQFGLKFNF